MKFRIRRSDKHNQSQSVPFG